MMRLSRIKKQVQQKTEESDGDMIQHHVCRRTFRLKTRVVGLRHRKPSIAAIFADSSWSSLPIKLQRKNSHTTDSNAIAIVLYRNVDFKVNEENLCHQIDSCISTSDNVVNSEDQNLLGYLPASFCLLLSPLLDSKKVVIHAAAFINIDFDFKTIPSSLDIELDVCGSISLDTQKALEESSLGDLSRQHFSQIIRRAQSRFASTDLVTQEELESGALYLSLSFDAQTLYVKLLQRKSCWFVHSESINGCCLGSLLETSAEFQDITAPLEQRRNILASLLPSLSVLELKALYKRFFNCSNAKGAKSEILAKLMEYIFSQRCIDGSPYFSTHIFAKNFDECCTTRCRVSLRHFQALVRLYRLQTLNFDSDFLSGERLYNLNLVEFVPTSLSSTTPFLNRQQFLELESALELASTCESFLNNKEYDSVANLIPLLRSKLSVSDKIIAPSFWLQFHPTTVYCYGMHLSIKALHKLKRFEDAVNESMFLLNDTPSLLLTGKRRGKCWARMLLIIDVHLKQPQLALSLCEAALSDHNVDSGSKIALQDRAIRLQKRDNELVLPHYIPAISLPETIPTTVITGRPLNSKIAEKSRFFGYDDNVVPVEELALQYFAKDGWQGFHDEGCLFRTLFGLLLWDVIWNQEFPNVFMASYQDAPLDLGTSDFYDVRRRNIESRLLDLESDLNTEEELSKVWRKQKGRICRGVCWDRWTLDELIYICAFINKSSLTAVFRLFAVNYSSWTGGLPDLVIYHPELRQFRFVEVKGPNDRLSEQQRAWLSRLHRFGFHCSVLKVKPPDKKSKMSRTVNVPANA